jgi:hypothetical protein
MVDAYNIVIEGDQRSISALLMKRQTPTMRDTLVSEYTASGFARQTLTSATIVLAKVEKNAFSCARLGMSRILACHEQR